MVCWKLFTFPPAELFVLVWKRTVEWNRVNNFHDVITERNDIWKRLKGEWANRRGNELNLGSPDDFFQSIKVWSKIPSHLNCHIKAKLITVEEQWCWKLVWNFPKVFRWFNCCLFEWRFLNGRVCWWCQGRLKTFSAFPSSLPSSNQPKTCNDRTYVNYTTESQ